MKNRHILFTVFSLATMMIFFAPLRDLVLNSFHNELYSHIVLIPFISGYFLFEKRKELFSNPYYSFLPGSAALLVGILLFLIGRSQVISLNANDRLSLMTLAVLVFWLGGIILFYGLKSFKTALFPLLFLFLMVPVPAFIMDKLIYSLQVCSTEATYVFFKIAGIPIIRDGFVFNLPGINIEVAKECSGIRSTLSLFIIGILSCYLFLKTWRSRGLLLLFLFPLAIFKNGLRIITLSLLGLYVDKSWLTNSSLHRDGGFVFFLIALASFGGIILLLRKWEFRTDKRNL
jgi:exosortase